MKGYDNLFSEPLDGYYPSLREPEEEEETTDLWADRDLQDYEEEEE
jgi:hypothetical protein